VRSALFASEEEAVGHLLEAVAVRCHPGARAPLDPDDFDYEVTASDGSVDGYQVKLSWDCMPMSSRKNLSATIATLSKRYEEEGSEFRGHFAPCYGKASTTRPPGQRYISLSSREFWSRVGDGDADFDIRVGEACALICTDFRSTLEDTTVAALVDELTAAAEAVIGDGRGSIDFPRLYREINR